MLELKVKLKKNKFFQGEVKSSSNQTKITVPSDMRKHFKAGDEVLVIKTEDEEADPDEE